MAHKYRLRVHMVAPRARTVGQTRSSAWLTGKKRIARNQHQTPGYGLRRTTTRACFFVRRMHHSRARSRDYHITHLIGGTIAIRRASWLVVVVLMVVCCIAQMHRMWHQRYGCIWIMCVGDCCGVFVCAH